MQEVDFSHTPSRIMPDESGVKTVATITDGNRF